VCFFPNITISGSLYTLFVLSGFVVMFKGDIATQSMHDICRDFGIGLRNIPDPWPNCLKVLVNGGYCC